MSASFISKNFTGVKNKLLVMIVLAGASLATHAQTTITGKDYTALTKFQPVSNVAGEQYNLCIAKINASGKYLILIEQTITDFTKREMDTTGFSVQLDLFKEIKREGKSWGELDRIVLPAATEQPITNSKGKTFAFDVTDAHLFDLKNQKIGELTLINRDTKSKSPSVVKRQLSLSDAGKNFFVSNNALLVVKNTRGSFDDVAPYKNKLIPLYSMFRKDSSFIGSILGAASETVVKGAITTATYTTPEGKYTIAYKDNLAEEITLYPQKKFKYLGKLFIMDKLPFEITNSNLGEFSSRGTSSSGDTVTDGIIYTFKDKTEHRIQFKSKGRYLEQVKVEIY